ncbi:MAG: hypothetical protein FWE89_06750 [Syntrophaceae bacterium]|nr:hypothetical protein [Syntrophaceae bacterium]
MDNEICEKCMGADCSEFRQCIFMSCHTINYIMYASDQEKGEEPAPEDKGA